MIFDDKFLDNNEALNDALNEQRTYDNAQACLDKFTRVWADEIDADPELCVNNAKKIIRATCAGGAQHVKLKSKLPLTR